MKNMWKRIEEPLLTAAILLPFLIVVGLFTRENRIKEQALVHTAAPMVSPTPQPTPSFDILSLLQGQLSGAPSSAQMSLEASYSALLTSKKSLTCRAGEAQAYVKQGSIRAHIAPYELLLTDDCAHIWKDGEKRGDSYCGVKAMIAQYGPYTHLLGTLDISKLPGIGSQVTPEILAGLKNVEPLIRSCKGGIAPTSVSFQKPTNVIFAVAKSPLESQKK